MVKIAIIGAGFMGETHAAAYQQIENASVVAVCEQDREKGEAYAERFGCACYPGLEEAVQECPIDVVDVCLPTFLHEEYVTKAARAGKHIFCEKPVTLSVESFDRMRRETERAHVMMFVGQVVRFWPEYVEAKRLLESGELGELKGYFAARRCEHPAWSEWYRRAENSGGGLLDLHLHDIDYACYLFGRPERVYAVGSKNSYGSWNHVYSILKFETGPRVAAEGILEMAEGYPFTTELRMIGSKKVYEYTMKAGKNLEDVSSSLRSAFLYGDGKADRVAVSTEDAYRIELQHFVDCIDKGVTPVIELGQVREVLCTIRALEQSLEEDREVTVSYE